MAHIDSKQDERLWDHHQTSNAVHLQGGHPRQDMVFREVKKRVKAGLRVLEIGFGDGYLLSRLATAYKCSGADVSGKNVARAKVSIKGDIDFQVIGTDGKLPYDDGYFNVFIASEVLEHMTDQELSVVVCEMNRILTDNGIAFITVPARESLRDNECFCPNCGHVFHKWGHKQRWDEEKARFTFSSFQVLSIKEFFTPYKSVTLLANLAGSCMWVVRTILNKFVDIPNKNYLIILKK